MTREGRHDKKGRTEQTSPRRSTLNLGILTVRDGQYHPNRRLSEAALERGHRVWLLHPYQVWPCLTPEPRALGLPAERLDLVAPRVGATIGDSGLALIRHLELMGIRLANGSRGVRLARNKIMQLQTLAAAGLPVLDSLLVTTPQSLEMAVERLGGLPVVAKALAGRQGSGVVLVDTPRVIELVANYMIDPRIGLLVQRFLPPQGRKDYRVLVLGEKAVAATRLSPPPGEFRSNVHLGGRGQIVESGGELGELAVAASRALDLDIAGVDLLQDPQGRLWLLEVNYSPGFRGLEQNTGQDIAGMMMDFMSRLARTE